MPAAKPGERRLQILQTLAEMLQQPIGEKITTAARPWVPLSDFWISPKT